MRHRIRPQLRFGHGIKRARIFSLFVIFARFCPLSPLAMALVMSGQADADPTGAEMISEESTTVSAASTEIFMPFMRRRPMKLN